MSSLTELRKANKRLTAQAEHQHAALLEVEESLQHISNECDYSRISTATVADELGKIIKKINKALDKR